MRSIKTCSIKLVERTVYNQASYMELKLARFLLCKGVWDLWFSVMLYLSNFKKKNQVKASEHCFFFF